MKTHVALTASLLAAACSTSTPPAETANPWQAQVARGAEVFADSCAECHGKSGQGTKKAPALVGASALPLEPRPDSKRTARFQSAADVAGFATANMPPEAEERAELSEANYWDVLAFALSANGLTREATVGPHNAASIRLH
jgi:cytochrome c